MLDEEGVGLPLDEPAVDENGGVLELDIAEEVATTLDEGTTELEAEDMLDRSVELAGVTAAVEPSPGVDVAISEDGIPGVVVMTNVVDTTSQRPNRASQPSPQYSVVFPQAPY